MNIFEHMNKVFFFYGLQSETKANLIQRFLLIVTMVIMVMDTIFWITIFWFDLRSIFHTSWAIKMVIRIISFLTYVSRHSKLIECTKLINAEYRDKFVSKVSILLVIVWLTSFVCMVPSLIKWTKDEVINDILGMNDERRTLIVFTIINTLGKLFD